MPITITWTSTNTGLNMSDTWLDSAATDRVIAWAKATYLSTDGTQPGNNAAARRASRAFISALRDAARKLENDAAVAAVPPPAPIDVAP